MAGLKVVMFCNYLNHHQVALADELYAALDAGFAFVVTCPIDADQLKGGIDYRNRSYCIDATQNASNYQKAFRLARESEVCIFGACSQSFAKERARHFPEGLSFQVGERWLKRGWKNIFSPVLLRWWWNYMRYYRKANFYKLCSSAFTASDDNRLFAYSGRSFKWGYFVTVPQYDFEVMYVQKPEVPALCFCSRFIGWKHPELPVMLAQRLKSRGYRFSLDLYGGGNRWPEVKRLVEALQVMDVVTLHGEVSNAEIKEAIGRHHILLLTSDKREGWGVIANEAMIYGAALVTSDQVGSAPYLVKNGETGMCFESGNLDSLFAKVSELLDAPERMKKVTQNGYSEMLRLWSPKNAVHSLLQLIGDLSNGHKSSIVEGPCSEALPL